MKVIAHRGASMEAPENTLKAFQKAIDLQVDFIECDIRLTQDKIPIVYHNATIEGIPIDTLTYNNIRNRDIGMGEKVPTLQQLLSLNFGKTGLMIEIKKLDSLDNLKIITNDIKANAPKKPHYVGSCLPEIVKALDPSLPRIGIANNMEALKIFSQDSIQIMALHYRLVTAEIIAHLHRLKMEVWCWTVDDPSFHIVGLDGIITNNVTAFLQIKHLR